MDYMGEYMPFIGGTRKIWRESPAQNRIFRGASGDTKKEYKD